MPNATTSQMRVYGVKYPSAVSIDGNHVSIEWAERRAPGAWGQFQDEQKAWIVWFNDPGARDEFQKLFGGMFVTLDRKIGQMTGQDAMNLIKRAS